MYTGCYFPAIITVLPITVLHGFALLYCIKISRHSFLFVCFHLVLFRTILLFQNIYFNYLIVHISMQITQYEMLRQDVQKHFIPLFHSQLTLEPLQLDFTIILLLLYWEHINSNFYCTAWLYPSKKSLLHFFLLLFTMAMGLGGSSAPGNGPINTLYLAFFPLGYYWVFLVAFLLIWLIMLLLFFHFATEFLFTRK